MKSRNVLNVEMKIFARNTLDLLEVQVTPILSRQRLRPGTNVVMFSFMNGDEGTKP
jgi:hypothetical protein